jgi:SPX domain protein involved in polyphosphate accumulation
MIREADRTEGGWMRPNVGDYPFNTLPDHEVALFPFSELVVRATDPVRLLCIYGCF